LKLLRVLLTLTAALLGGLVARADSPTASAPSDAPDTVGWAPTRPVRIVVYMSPGGLIDYTARKFADVARKHVNQPIVIINRPGAGGIVAIEEFLQTPNDGHAVLAVTRSNVAKLIASKREDLFERLDWFALLIRDPECVIVDSRSATPDWESLRAANIASEGRQLWPGPEIGGLDHLFALKLWEKADMSGRWIPYQSGGQAMAALMGGFGSAYVGNPYDLRGKPDLRMAAVAAPARLPNFPDTPTFRELGLEGLEDETMWRGFAFRDDLPEAARRWWDELCRKVAADPDWRNEWERDGIDTSYVGREEFNRMVATDRDEFTERLAAIGLLADPSERLPLLTSLATGWRQHGLFVLMIGVNIALAFGLARTGLREHRVEVLIIAGLASVAVLFLVLTAAFPPPNAVDRLGPSGVPRLWLAILMPLLVVQFAVTARSRLKLKKREEAVPHGRGLLAGFVALLLAYVAAIPLLGYVAATVPFVPASMLLLGYRKAWVVAAVTAGWCLFAAWVFRDLLHVALPQGLLGVLTPFTTGGFFQ
jgi:tripartite-type tricarboxylate transporter receptor subunit TctC